MNKINYLKSCRKKAGLSQSDISHIIGKPSLSAISKIEDGLKIPDLKTSFYLSMLYQKPVCELFEKLHEDCTFELLRRVDLLLGEYSKSTDEKGRLKVSFLEQVIGNIKNTTK